MMDILDTLEQKIEGLVKKVQRLEAENRDLQSSLDQERQNKEQVLKRLDQLLQKIQEADIE
jgi:cell division protein ZapB